MSIHIEGSGYTNVINQRNTGTYSFTLDAEYQAKFLFVGNGCGGGSSQRDSYWQTSSGGSGACFQGVVLLKPGTYTVTIGALGYGYNVDNQYNNSYGSDSSDSFIIDPDGNELIRVGCGARGKTVGAGGIGGTLTLGTLNIISTTIAKNGNTGGHHRAYGGCNQQYAASAYDGTNTGYGAGKSSLRGQGNVYGVAGIIQIDIKELSKVLTIKDLYYSNGKNTQKIAIVYKKDLLVYSIFANNVIMSQSSTNTYTINVPVTAKYKLTFVGNGGSGGSAQTYGAWYQSCGGSGAAFEGIVKLKKGTYTLVIGTLGYGYNINSSQNYTGGKDSTDSFLKDSNGNELIRVGCGIRGKTAKKGAAGGKLTLGTLEIVETIIAKNGNQGQIDNPNGWSSTNAYALSAYDGTKTGYGAGIGSWYGGGNVYGKAGIFKLSLV